MTAQALGGAPSFILQPAPPAFIIEYPQTYAFDGYLLAEHRIAEAHTSAGLYQSITPTDVARLRALPRLPSPGPFEPKNRRWAGRTIIYEKQELRPWSSERRKRRLGPFHRITKEPTP